MSENQGIDLLSHLTELRSRLLKTLAWVGVVFLCLFPFANNLYEYLAAPLTSQIDASMVAIDVASPFLTPFKLTMLASVVLSIPIILYQIWAFVSPGLYPAEKQKTMPLTVWSTVLFYLGMMFAYFVVFPLMFEFFSSVAPTGVEVMTDISRYLDFVITIFIAFGLSFEVPIVTLMLVKADIVTTQSLTEKRPYVIVGAFFFGMVLTPPDIISQVLLAVPIWLLFELGLFISKIIVRRSDLEKIIRDDG